MYFDEILDKIIPGINITKNNESKEGYKDLFKYIKYYIDNLFKNRDNFESFTTYFKIAPYNVFNKIFNKKKIQTNILLFSLFIK